VNYFFIIINTTFFKAHNM